MRTLANASFGRKPDGRFDHDRRGATSKKMANKRELIVATPRRSSEVGRHRRRSFTLTHPMSGPDQGHCDGHTRMDFDALLEVPEAIQGKFLLRPYRNASLGEIARWNRRRAVELRLTSPMARGQGRTARDKMEVLTANYPKSLKFDERVNKELAGKD